MILACENDSVVKTTIQKIKLMKTESKSAPDVPIQQPSTSPACPTCAINPTQSSPVKASPTKSRHTPGHGKETVKFLALFDHLQSTLAIFGVNPQLQPSPNICLFPEHFLNLWRLICVYE
jgi:hypothetical protein